MLNSSRVLVAPLDCLISFSFSPSLIYHQKVHTTPLQSTWERFFSSFFFVPEMSQKTAEKEHFLKRKQKFSPSGTYTTHKKYVYNLKWCIIYHIKFNENVSSEIIVYKAMLDAQQNLSFPWEAFILLSIHCLPVCFLTLLCLLCDIIVYYCSKKKQQKAQAQWIHKFQLWLSIIWWHNDNSIKIIVLLNFVGTTAFFKF